MSRNLKDCLNKSCATAEESSQDESAASEYIPTDEETSEVVDSVMCEEQSKAIERRFFVTIVPVKSLRHFKLTNFLDYGCFEKLNRLT